MKRGSEVYIQAQVSDATKTPPLPYNPSVGVKITLTNPVGAVIVNLAAMTNESVSVYSYLYQSLTTDKPGVWLGSFRIENDGHIVLTEPMQLFVLTA